MQNPVDLTKIEVPFGLLSEDTKVALFRAYLNGEKILCQGVHLEYPRWNPENIYCVKPKRKTTINWGHVSKKYKYIFRHGDDSVFLSTHRPRDFWCGSWVNPSHCHILDASCFESLVVGDIDPSKDISMRGEKEDK